MSEPADRLGLCILGLGLMGGSLARAARERIPGVRITGWNRGVASRQQARQTGVFDLVSDDVADALSGADIVVLCIPVLAAVELVKAHLDHFGSKPVVTDVGSTKQDVCASLEPMLGAVGCPFVGSHPICGGERSGFDAASADLYEGAVVVVTSGTESADGPFERIASMWRQVGARVVSLGAAEHDTVLARTSHLPHVAAAALARTAAREPLAGLGLSGSGLVDTTRIAAGSEDVWHDVLKSNAAAIVPELKALAAELERVAEFLGQGDFEAARTWLAEARGMRAQLLEAQRELFAEHAADEF